MNHKLCAVATFVLLTGCTTPILKPADEKVGRTEIEATRSIETLRRADKLAELPTNNVQRIDKAWLPVSKVDEYQDPHMTQMLSRDVVVNRSFKDLSDAAAYITYLTGIPATVTFAHPEKEDASAAAAPGGAPGMSAPMPASSDSGPASGLSTVSLVNREAPIVFSGSLSGLLDLIAARYNIFWEWERNSINFFKTKSKTFRLVALPGDTSFSSSVGSKSEDDSGGGGTSTATTKSDNANNSKIEFSSLSVWKGIEDSLNTMISEDGKLTVTPSTGTITVDDTPTVLARVGKFIDEQNEALSRQVVINVRVLSVDLNSSDQYGLNWNEIYRRSLGVDFTNNFTAPDTGASLALGVLPGSPFNGSNVFLTALSEEGKVSQVTSASIMTINNQPAPIQVGNKLAYLASSTLVRGTSGAGDTITLEPGEVSTGFNMSVLPHILDTKKLMLQYAVDLSALKSLEPISALGTSIQLPEVDTRNFLQRVIINSGDTLVISGFEQFDSSGDGQGVGHPRNALLGGSATEKEAKRIIVVLIQPVLMGSSE